MPTDEASIRQLLDSHPDPETGRPMGSMGQIGAIEIQPDNIAIEIGLSSHSMPIQADVCDAIESKVVASNPGQAVKVSVNEHPRPAARVGQTALRAKSVIAVGSGKGGVGKSSVAASIALALRHLGSKVGLMDADVYGPSLPHLLGLGGRPAMSEDKRIEPITLRDDAAGRPMPVMSMGFLVEPDQAVIWRGPMLHGSINQFLGMTDWGELDYLIIDMPPGTGDVALTLSQAVPLSGSVVVCTPQEVALLDAVKAIAMYKKVNIPILGIVENMSGFLCPDNGKTYDIFGSGGAREKAEELKVPFLGGLPIDIELRKACDDGLLPALIRDNETARRPFERIAQSLVRTIASRNITAPPKPSLPTL
ncbi:Mrp/NBP35 family ATP-binding protein [Roseiconus lacunae]|uniref:Iron-sulfur cluster carrier protein n=1 Tax=Roseiconus lacunae TaxID=2605694 RepID=A0ABT7PLU5_9BACT|nr:Mrp/NBP35 family ATP-binding protein [Roseiconus lacunae]MCD0458073.1 Mrp/NBP35 family ATP-binding protein [Roseiconus lacunae]MDM4017487.1 Mrp/NBP35 family ATP-binding protein [Roseiconus lacunae]WRQ53736.1 Mrp/NBP35 family ATP-binding protein [Stieleria sp. HD01]